MRRARLRGGEPRRGASAARGRHRPPPRQPEIDALEAAIARSDEETAFSRLLLEYTNIRAPVSGQVVSSLDEVPLGAFLPVGGLLAEIEDNRVVIAEVEVPEITIADVEVGAPADPTRADARYGRLVLDAALAHARAAAKV